MSRKATKIWLFYHSYNIFQYNFGLYKVPKTTYKKFIKDIAQYFLPSKYFRVINIDAYTSFATSWTTTGVSSVGLTSLFIGGVYYLVNV